MIVLADLPIEPNVIIVFAMVVFAGIKALLDKAAQSSKGEPPPLEEEEYFDPYDQYEEELERQRQEMGIPPPIVETAPPPLPAKPVPTPIVIPKTPARPSLTTAEKAALENFKRLSPSKRRSTSSTKARVKKNLASPTAAREALLLAEILGPPKALKSEKDYSSASL